MAYNNRAKKLAYERRYRAANREKFRGYDRKKYAKRKAKDPEALRLRILAQRRKKLPTPTRPEPEWCECCGRLPGTVLCLDHDHVTGKFRGWLCNQCNRALGLFGDSLADLTRAVQYLARAR